MTLLRPPDWTRSAACADHPQLPPTAWDRNTTAARTVCAQCPVRYACARTALDDAIPTGLWGGLDPDDRAAIARGDHGHTGFDRPGLPRHGQRARYVHRDQPCRCNDCREAHRRWAADRRAQGAWTPTDTTDRRMTA